MPEHSAVRFVSGFVRLKSKNPLESLHAGLRKTSDDRSQKFEISHSNALAIETGVVATYTESEVSSRRGVFGSILKECFCWNEFQGVCFLSFDVLDAYELKHELCGMMCERMLAGWWIYVL